MDSDQLKSLMGKDPYLKQYKCTILEEKELPEILSPNEGYFVLLPGIRKNVGHWILLESFDVAAHGFSYWDPLGQNPSTTTHEKLLKSSLVYQAPLFINAYIWQLSGTVICGAICIYLGLLRSRGFSPQIILTQKTSGDARTDAMIIVDIINSLLGSRFPKVPRFSLDFL